jgi:general secretion pathway protein I
MRRLLIHRRGFTLIEALVAFAILALAMSQLLAAAGGAAHNESRADFLLRAGRQGRSQLEALGIDGPMSAGESTGAYADGLLWRLVVEPYHATRSAAGNKTLASYWARLTIRRPGPQKLAPETLTLTTLKIVPVKEPRP